MKELDIQIKTKRTRKYSSYVGENEVNPENVIARDFTAKKPFEKILTDITEFSLSDGKVYLSPMIDCFTGAPVSYSISQSPNAELANSSLEKILKHVIPGVTIVHSDRGFHYRTNSWQKLISENKIKQSMSKKGCTPDNSACEGFFGTLKKEFFHNNDWRFVKSEEFIVKLTNYLEWFINKRIKKRLNYMSPNDFMLQYLKVQ